MKPRLRLVILSLFLPCLVLAKTISPLSCGLLEAKNGEERFWALYKTHTVAKEKGWKVSYKGITQIELDIPSNAKTIPLSSKTDFCKVSIIVTNTKNNNFCLFELTQELHPVSIPKQLLETYDFRSSKELRCGRKLLVIEDENPWVENRAGHSYGAIRRDVLLLKQGKAVNETISPYNNDSSSPKCSYASVSKRKSEFKNIRFRRTLESSCKTFLIRVLNMDNVLLQGIEIMTPKPVTMNADMAISIQNCSNIVFDDIHIDQTYSFDENFGYGIKMNNVWNSTFNHIVGDAAWGIFGNNNINTSHIYDSSINRFDTHCYGRDFFFENCEISQYGLPQSSFMGIAEFKNCTFRNATVCMARTDYNAFSPFTLKLIDCTIYLDKKHTALLRLGTVGNVLNKREELRTKHSPSLYIVNSTVVLAKDISTWSLIQARTPSNDYSFDYIGDIQIDGLQVKGHDAVMKVFDNQITCAHPIVIDIKGLNLFTDEESIYSQATQRYSYAPTLILNANKDGKDTYRITNSLLNYNPKDFPHYNIEFSGCTLGRIRYYNTNNGDVSSRRIYDDCVIILNDIDSEYYTLDDNADYTNCVFRPMNVEKKLVPISMDKVNSSISFQNCTSEVEDLFGNGMNSREVLRQKKYNFTR